MLQDKNIAKDDFFENLLIIKSAQDRHNYYFDEVKDLLFTTNQKGEIERKFEQALFGERTVVEDEDTEREKRVVEELMHQRNRANFLQNKVGGVQMARNREPTGDAEQEFAKVSKTNLAVPEASLLVNPEHIEGNYVIINKGLTEGQVKSIAQSL